MTFAFPMVLFGTFLTAIVGKFMFPFNWSWDLSMTFGAILSSTDPISVAGLMKTLGAPPRLQMHISGESLLNDGAAVLFFNIFSSRYFAQMGIEGFGKKVGWLEGFIQFFRLSLGGAGKANVRHCYCACRPSFFSHAKPFSVSLRSNWDVIW